MSTDLDGTREGWHRVAEHVLAAGQYTAAGTRGSYSPATDADPGTPLEVDPAAAAELAAWFTPGDDHLAVPHLYVGPHERPPADDF